MSCLLVINSSYMKLISVSFAVCLGKLVYECFLLIREHIINFLYKKCLFIQFNHLTA